jgi:hypothetical protein
MPRLLLGVRGSSACLKTGSRRRLAQNLALWVFGEVVRSMRLPAYQDFHRVRRFLALLDSQGRFPQRLGDV